MMVGYKDKITIEISERDANTIRFALFNYGSLLRELGRTNDLAEEAIAASYTLLDSVSDKRDSEIAIRDEISKKARQWASDLDYFGDKAARDTMVGFSESLSRHPYGDAALAMERGEG